MREAIQRYGAAALGCWVLANIVLFIAKDEINVWSALIVFFVGLWTVNPIIAFAAVCIQTLLAYGLIKEMRNVKENPDWEPIARKSKPIKGFVMLLNCWATFVVAYYGWKFLVD